MYVRPTARGRGLARLLLATCEQAAVDLGFDELWLETGDAQPEAVALYLSAGYESVPAFGQYQHSPRSITLANPCCPRVNTVGTVTEVRFEHRRSCIGDVGFFRPPADSSRPPRRVDAKNCAGAKLKYVLTMAVRVVVFILAAALFHGVLRWIAMFLALVLPWLAVVMQTHHAGHRRRPNPVTPRGPASLPAAQTTNG